MKRTNIYYPPLILSSLTQPPKGAALQRGKTSFFLQKIGDLITINLFLFLNDEQ